MQMNLELAHKHFLSPNMELSVRILQMDNMELSDYLQQISIENPVVELEEPVINEDFEIFKHKQEWLNSDENRITAVAEYTPVDPADISLWTYYDSMTLERYLVEQINECQLDKKVFKTAVYIISCLDENGYFSEDVQYVCERLFVSREVGFDALRLVQSLEPAGVGARTLNECLILQLDRANRLTYALKVIINNYLTDLANSSLNIVSKKSGLSKVQIKEALQAISKLNPRPCAAISPCSMTNYISPDIMVLKSKSHLDVKLCNDRYPVMKINKSYMDILSHTSDPQVLQYIDKKLKQANWIRKCIDDRKSTLLRIANVIVQLQSAFFNYGPSQLATMRLMDIADITGFHPSTISRAIRNKYLQSNYGIFPLKYFFAKGPEQNLSSSVSSKSIINKISDLISTEDSKNPLSDQSLKEILGEQGFSISRRTIAKYRDQMNIKSSFQRRSN